MNKSTLSRRTSCNYFEQLKLGARKVSTKLAIGLFSISTVLNVGIHSSAATWSLDKKPTACAEPIRTQVIAIDISASVENFSDALEPINEYIVGKARGCTLIILVQFGTNADVIGNRFISGDASRYELVNIIDRLRQGDAWTNPREVEKQIDSIADKIQVNYPNSLITLTTLWDEISDPSPDTLSNVIVRQSSPTGFLSDDQQSINIVSEKNLIASKLTQQNELLFSYSLTQDSTQLEENTEAPPPISDTDNSRDSWLSFFWVLSFLSLVLIAWFVRNKNKHSAKSSPSHKSTVNSNHTARNKSTEAETGVSQSMKTEPDHSSRPEIIHRVVFGNDNTGSQSHSNRGTPNLAKSKINKGKTSFGSSSASTSSARNAASPNTGSTPTTSTNPARKAASPNTGSTPTTSTNPARNVASPRTGSTSLDSLMHIKSSRKNSAKYVIVSCKEGEQEQKLGRLTSSSGRGYTIGNTANSWFTIESNNDAEKVSDAITIKMEDDYIYLDIKEGQDVRYGNERIKDTKRFLGLAFSVLWQGVNISFKVSDTDQEEEENIDDLID